MTALELARERYRQRRILAEAVEDEAIRLWRQVDSADLNGWARLLPRLLTVLAGAQLLAASDAGEYVGAALDQQRGSTPDPDGQVNSEAFAGIASDGRSLTGLLWSPVVATKIFTGEGFTADRAMAGGQATLRLITRTQVADAGRVADGVAIAARPRTGYVRMLVGKTCSRCINLAGRWYRYSAGFQRHPGCDCIHVPSSGEAAAKAEGLMTDPRAHFESLSPAEQDRAYGKAGAQAIREGADMNQIVNARRGMSSAGTTTEGTTRRGLASSTLAGRERLMPERIYRIAADRDEVLELLRSNGYLL